MGYRTNAAKLDFSEILSEDIEAAMVSMGAEVTMLITIALNLTAIVGELVGARLIAHGGSLLNLAKQPRSTVQILGAEKALFRALKTKHATPMYGLIYRANNQDSSLGIENCLKLEARLRSLEGRELGRSAGTIRDKPKIEAYNKDFKKGDGAMITPANVLFQLIVSVSGIAYVIEVAFQTAFLKEKKQMVEHL
ncbi:hypothetical protein QVD17_37941 [Tagetes erecta]|uniref:Nop domain-containing protein n=1 Tax=Tagetes erecta TaxID=13708 RepID=A0AAD8NKH5_TARER|nr:hypothetical protein QVD17_37941 [Tagetes erecta]